MSWEDVLPGAFFSCDNIEGVWVKNHSSISGTSFTCYTANGMKMAYAYYHVPDEDYYYSDRCGNRLPQKKVVRKKNTTIHYLV